MPYASAEAASWPAVVVVMFLALVAALAVVSEERGWSAAAVAVATTARTEAEGRVTWRSRLAGVTLAALAGLVCVGWAMARPAEAVEAPRLVLRVPAIQEGAMLLAEASGARILIDGGPTTSAAVTALGDVLRPWDRTVDVVALTDPREAYVLGLPRVFQRYRVGLFLDAADDYPSAAYRQLQQTVVRRGVRRAVAEPGTEITVGPAIALEALGPIGDASTVGPLAFRLRVDDFSVLVPVDGTAAQMRALLAAEQSLESTILLLTDRATRQPGAAALLRAVSPELVVVQGAPRAAAGAPPLEPMRVAIGDGEPEPTWHYTQTDGALLVELHEDGYRLVLSH
jgi:beta-lactamase superfamily II metal-dependent hydrolase